MLINCPECKREVSDSAPACPGCGYVLNAPAPRAAAPGALSTQTQILIEQRLANDAPNIVVAYLLWFFLGVFGGHRFYLNRTGSGIAMLLISITIVGLLVTWVWMIVDAFLIPGIVREQREQLREHLLARAAAAA